MRDQFYLFTMPGDMCPVWAETFQADGTHVVAPMPMDDTADAIAWLKASYPHATVDELCEQADIDQCRGWAATMPLEQLPAVTT